MTGEFSHIADTQKAAAMRLCRMAAPNAQQVALSLDLPKDVMAMKLVSACTGSVQLRQGPAACSAGLMTAL